VHSWQPMTSYRTNQPVDRKLFPRAVDAHLLQIAHFNIFVLAHKNANEPAGVLPQWQNSGSTCVKCYGRCNTALSSLYID
jgi:hypothetical protein